MLREIFSHSYEKRAKSTPPPASSLQSTTTAELLWRRDAAAARFSRARDVSSSGAGSSEEDDGADLELHRGSAKVAELARFANFVFGGRSPIRRRRRGHQSRRQNIAADEDSDDGDHGCEESKNSSCESRRLANFSASERRGIKSVQRAAATIFRDPAQSGDGCRDDGRYPSGAQPRRYDFHRPCWTQVVAIRQMVERLQLDDFELDAGDLLSLGGDEDDPPVHHIQVAKSKNVDLRLLLCPKGARLRLHDHPGMAVIIKSLLGNPHVRNYSLVDPFSVPEEVRTARRPPTNPNRWLSKIARGSGAGCHCCLPLTSIGYWPQATCSSSALPLQRPASPADGCQPDIVTHEKGNELRQLHQQHQQRDRQHYQIRGHADLVDVLTLAEPKPRGPVSLARRFGEVNPYGRWFDRANFLNRTSVRFGKPEVYRMTKREAAAAQASDAGAGSEDPPGEGWDMMRPLAGDIHFSQRVFPMTLDFDGVIPAAASRRVTALPRPPSNLIAGEACRDDAGGRVWPSAEFRSTCLLLPDEGNLHQISAPDGPCIVLDLLAPPYSSPYSRICRAFTDLGNPTEQEAAAVQKHLSVAPLPVGMTWIGVTSLFSNTETRRSSKQTASSKGGAVAPQSLSPDRRKNKTKEMMSLSLTPNESKENQLLPSRTNSKSVPSPSSASSVSSSSSPVQHPSPFVSNAITFVLRDLIRQQEQDTYLRPRLPSFFFGRESGQTNGHQSDTTKSAKSTATS